MIEHSNLGLPCKKCPSNQGNSAAVLLVDTPITAQEPGGVEQVEGPARREGLEDWTQSVGSWSIKDFGQSFADRPLDMEAW